VWELWVGIMLYNIFVCRKMGIYSNTLFQSHFYVRFWDSVFLASAPSVIPCPVLLNYFNLFMLLLSVFCLTAPIYRNYSKLGGVLQKARCASCRLTNGIKELKAIGTIIYKLKILVCYYILHIKFHVIFGKQKLKIVQVSTNIPTLTIVKCDLSICNSCRTCT